ncbi:magnesium ion transmembrane transporter [Musa troglodytarum]|uniref:Magnesium ion transmembrane transporter n=1 Tax=Musa troglodytarum TaxID=320322 RepID=A0A9E7H2R1_9LILI|nr:magnesium ion transmembrane transporter [Musa troglodytarum]URE22528.1 magnesium ion transmembrane transporter [Musa troglodytarum]
MAVAASSSSSSSSLIILFLDLPRLLRQNHRSASQSPLLCPPAKNPSRSARRTKLLVPAAAFSPLLPSLRRKLTPPPSRSLADDRSGDDGAAVVEYVADVVDNGSIRAVGIGARPGSPRPQRNAGSADSISLGIKEPVYEVELGSKAGAVKQMLLDLLEDPHEIRRICIMGRNCTVRHGTNYMECSIPLDKQIAQEEEEEIEMLLENYLQRCESCHGQAERLLDSAKEMEDSIAVNLRLPRHMLLDYAWKLKNSCVEVDGRTWFL